jgi:2'-5' RNA ligase
MSLAIFLLPNKSLKKEIIQWKNLVKKAYSSSPYCDHPPHSTIINADIKNKVNAIHDIKNSVTGFKQFEITIDHNSVFLNDTMTGGHTLYFGIKKNEFLFSLQKAIANCIKKYKIDTNLEAHGHSDIIIKRSFKKYGFPYVGSHWLPHFSVASVITNEDDELIKNFLKENYKIKFIINEFSIWNVNGEKHTKIETVNLS